jgi:hypothetical protein
MSLPVTFPPIFDIGGDLRRVKVIFLVSENFEQSNTLLIDLSISPKHLHLSGLQIRAYQS